MIFLQLKFIRDFIISSIYFSFINYKTFLIARFRYWSLSRTDFFHFHTIFLLLRDLTISHLILTNFNLRLFTHKRTKTTNIFILNKMNTSLTLLTKVSINNNILKIYKCLSILFGKSLLFCNQHNSKKLPNTPNYYNCLL